MTNRIFETFAPLYWAASLPVIPLRERNKMPDITQWSTFGARMPTSTEQAHWLASYPRGNIGLPLGPASGLAMIDIDTEDEALIAAILDILPPSPWKRVGKKGMGLAYRFEGQRNFKLRGADGGMILEFLGLGNQMVMPPSIHPETGQPYTANANLWDVIDQIPELGEDIEDRLRALLDAKGFAIGAGGRSSPIDIVPAGERDVQMIRHAGYLARVVLGIDKSSSFSLAEALGHMYHWVEAYTARVSGDAMDPSKGVAKLLEFLVKDLEKGRTLPSGWDAGLSDELREHPTIAKMIELNTTQRWDLDRARNWLAGKVAEKPNDVSWVVERVMEIVGEVAKDENFSDFEFNMLSNYILDVAGRQIGVKKSDLKAMFKAARAGDSAEELTSHVEIARAALEELQKYGEIRFDHGQFWQWSGSCFKKLEEQTLYMHVADNVKGSILVRRHSDYAAIVQVMARICGEQLIQSEEKGINFANGFVTADLVGHDHDPKFGATFTLPFEYDRDNAGRCPRFMDFLYSCWGEEPDYAERVMALQEMFAATLFKIAPDLQRAFLLFGRAGTGKSVMLNVLRSLLPPDAVTQLGPQTWGERFSLVDLVGAAANIVGELPEKGMISGNVFKEVVEGSPVRSEFKGKDAFLVTPRCAHWFASNYLPVSADSTRGFTRRWLILDFNKTVPAEQRIANLAEQIVADERDAIAAWAMEAIGRLLGQGDYTMPESHEARVRQMRRINNSVQAYLEDARDLELGREGVTMKVQDLYDKYVSHLANYRRGNAVGFERFIQMLEELDLNVSQDMLGDYVVAGVMVK